MNPVRRLAAALAGLAGALLPDTLQLCIHCHQNPAGFWVSRKHARTVRRPWCLSCCAELDRSRYDLIPFSELPPERAAADRRSPGWR